MEIKLFEELIKKEISAVIIKIFDDVPRLPIDVRQGERVGDAISKFIESKFVEYTQKTFLLQRITSISNRENKKSMGRSNIL